MGDERDLSNAGQESELNFTGQKIFQKEVTSSPDKIALDLSHLPKGIYVVHVMNREKWFWNKVVSFSVSLPFRPLLPSYLPG